MCKDENCNGVGGGAEKDRCSDSPCVCEAKNMEEKIQDEVNISFEWEDILTPDELEARRRLNELEPESDDTGSVTHNDMRRYIEVRKSLLKRLPSDDELVRRTLQIINTGEWKEVDADDS